MNLTILNCRNAIIIFITPRTLHPQKVNYFLYQELDLNLEPLNVLYRLPDNVFDEDNSHVEFTSYDTLILRTVNASELHNEMTRVEFTIFLKTVLVRLNST